MSRVAACFLFIASFSVPAQDIVPFSTSNQSPIIRVHGLPFIDRGSVLDPGRTRFGLLSDTANNFVKKSNNNESLLFDGETQRFTFIYNQGLDNGWEWGLRVPYLGHGAGKLDGLVDSWHDLFGFPDGGRDSYPQNRLTYRYTRNGITRVNVTDSTSGTGDIQINGAWQWQKSRSATDANLALRAQATLPTGDSDSLLGSGGLDLAFWISGDRKESWLDFPGTLWGGAGILLLGDGEVLEGQQRKMAVFGTIGTGARVTPGISLKVQLDYHSPLYKNSRLTPVSGHALQIIMGGDIRLSDDAMLDIAIKEDPTVHASPDVVFHIGLTIEG